MVSRETGVFASRRLWWLSVASIAGGYLLWTYGVLRQETLARWQDTAGYLGHALYIAEHGGFWGFLRESFSGTFPITERHPLYMLLLAPLASRTAEFFWYAKLLNMALGLAVVLSLIWIAQQRFGRVAALIAGTMYALSGSLVVAASHVDNEPLFVLCSLWTWWFLNERASSVESPPAAASRWALAGVFLALAYLTKSPAILMLVAVVVASLWHSRGRLALDRRLWVLIAIVAAVSSPLLIRNVLGHGTLFYEGVNSNIMWLDDWTDIGDQNSVIYYDQYGATTLEKNGMPTASQYFETHTLGDVLDRMGRGLYTELRIVIPSALGPGFDVPRGRTLGFGVFALALAGWWLRRRSWDATLVFLWSGAFLAFFSWNTLFPEIRYLAPLVPVWMAYAAHALSTLAQRIVAPAWQQRAVCAGVLLAIAGGVGWSAASGAYARPQPMMEMSAPYMRFIDWLKQNIQPSDRIMIGETRNFHGLLWLVDRPVKVLLMSNAQTLEEFLSYLSQRDTRYLLMHAEYFTHGNPSLAAALEPYFETGPDGSIREKQTLPGWRRVYSDVGPAPQFILYEAER